MALLLLTFLFPVAMCLLFWPTPAVDVREHINDGLTFPLFTWKNPPLEQWLTGAVALTGVREAWPYVLAAQALNCAALVYLFKIAKAFIGESSAVPIVIAYCGSIYLSVTLPEAALNADQIQGLFWLGLIYHGLSAIRADRWLDWILAGLFAALALLSKYFSIPFLAAFVLAAILVPAPGAVLRRPGFYVAGLVCCLVLTIHLVPLVRWTQSGNNMFVYGMDTVESWSSYGRRLESFGHYLSGLLLHGLPFLIALALATWQGSTRVVALRRENLSTVIVATMVILTLVFMIAIFAFGFRYRPRYSSPIMPLALLAIRVFSH
jgi:4-amino-4-deoxy-L-arabinose transferase-like glycosyltransferase